MVAFFVHIFGRHDVLAGLQLLDMDRLAIEALEILTAADVNVWELFDCEMKVSASVSLQTRNLQCLRSYTMAVAEKRGMYYGFGSSCWILSIM